MVVLRRGGISYERGTPVLPCVVGYSAQTFVSLNLMLQGLLRTGVKSNNGKREEEEAIALRRGLTYNGNLKKNGNKVYYTECSLLVTLKNSCSKLHCQKK